MSVHQRLASVDSRRAWGASLVAALLAACVLALGVLSPVRASAIDGDGGTGLLATSDEEQSLETVLLSAFIRRDESPIDVERFNMAFPELNDVYTKVLREHPELFDVQVNWVDASANGDIITSITPAYLLTNYDYEQVCDMRGRFAKGIADAMSWIPANGSELDKVKAAHDWLCSHVVYDDATEAEHDSTGGFEYQPTTYGLIITNREPFYSYCAYGALAECSCVCEGYAEAYKLLMDKVGVRCETVSAHGHEWNLVYVEGDWYHVDATWDSPRWDPKVAPFEQRYASPEWVDINYDMYFMKSDQGIIDAEKFYHEDDPNYTVIHSDFMALNAGAATNTQYDTTTANSWDGKNPRPGIQPQNQVTDFTLSLQEMTLRPGDSAKLEIWDLDPYDANPYMAVWWSDNPEVASVLSDGTVVATGEEGAATVYCNFAGTERTCNVAVGAAVEKGPRFLEPAVDTTGRIAMRIPVLIPEIEGTDWYASVLDYNVDGKAGRNASIGYDRAEIALNEEGVPVAWFTIPLTSIEMAQNVTARFTYPQDGVFTTIESGRYTLEEVVRHADLEGRLTSFEQALIDYGYHAQQYFSAQNGWSLGGDYWAMGNCYTYGYDKDAVLSGLANADMTKDLGTSNVKKVCMSQRLESDTTVDLNIYLKKSGTLNATAVFNGKSFKATKVNATRYRIRISGISAKELNDAIQVSGTAGGDFSFSLTPMTYAKAILSSNAFGEAGNNAMAALYYYHQLAQQ